MARHRRKRKSRAARLRSARRRGGPIPPDFPDSDDDFAFIAGYTEGGAPYGVSWEEMERGPGPPPEPPPPRLSPAEIARRFGDDDDLPF